MGVREIIDNDQHVACMFDSTTGQAFGPLFESADVPGLALDEQVRAFIAWMQPDDVRKCGELRLREEHAAFVAACNVKENHDDDQ